MTALFFLSSDPGKRGFVRVSHIIGEALEYNSFEKMLMIDHDLQSILKIY